ncbi:HET-domain-containing protein [Ophiobolus disseminans]|uniref:HET-domain-containing protein n=1 Tax=Ophiobolus disseminans TaxID=1469910 RepID=A0A6A6ZT80_9PLEO|nr:HET-domain-containing protein [Ophiobolus disseminans]
MRTEQGDALPLTKLGRPTWWSETYNLCDWCSKIPTDGLESSRELLSRDVTASKLADSPCRICQLIAGSVPLYRFRDTSHRLTWIIDRSAGKQSNGTICLEPVVEGRNYSGLNLPILTVIPSNPEALAATLPELVSELVDFRVVKHWIRCCNKGLNEDCITHKECIQKPGNSLGTFKVIDCRKRRVISAQPGCTYVALSYVWGQPAEIEDVGDSGLPSKLPRTIVDSLTVATELQYRYLWVDRYCIDQTAAEDKHCQIQQMGAIYASADLTIIAASGKTPSKGLPGVSLKRPVSPNYECLGPLTFVRHRTDGIGEIHNSIWASRGWTFQESYLSRRRLYFTDDQMVFICNDFAQPEAGVDGNLPIERHQLGDFGDSLPQRSDLTKHTGQLGSAMALLEEYTKRTLSYDSDAVNAIAGALNTLHPIRQVWGLPLAISSQPDATGKKSSRLQIALHWFHPFPVHRRPSFPSWSPLGWKGPARFYGHNQPVAPLDSKIRIRLPSSFKNTNTVVADRTTSKLLTQASLWLQITASTAQLSLIELDYRKDSQTNPQHRGMAYVVFPWSSKENDQHHAFDVCIPPLWDSEPPPENERKSVICAFLMGGPRWWRKDESRCIILLLQDYGSHYQRIGCVVYPKGPGAAEGSEKCLAVRRDTEGTVRTIDEVWLRGICWEEYEPSWLNGSVKKTFWLG